MTFTAITVGPWVGNQGSLTHSLYVLGADGHVYKLGAGDKWTKLGKGGAADPHPTQPTAYSPIYGGGVVDDGEVPW